MSNERLTCCALCAFYDEPNYACNRTGDLNAHRLPWDAPCENFKQYRPTV